MELILDSNSAKYQIQNYCDNKIQINNHWYTKSLIISSEQLIENWPPQQIDELKSEHFSDILMLKPTIVIIGTGQQQHFIASNVLQDLISQQIGIEVMNTAAACRTFTVLTSEGRNVVAALIL